MVQPRLTKRLILYRNGDPSFRPVSYLYNSQKIRTFEKLLDEFDEKCPPLRGGAVTHLYSIDGKNRYRSIEEFAAEDENELAIVVAGNEPYKPIKNGYQSIGKKNQRNNESNISQEGRSLNRRSNSKRPKDQQIFNRAPDPNQVKRFTVLRSGDPFFEPKQYLFRKRNTPSLEKLLEDLETVVPPRDGGPVRYIYTTNGDEILELDKLENGAEYVIAGETGYEEPGKGFLSTGQKRGGSSRRGSRSRSKSPATDGSRTPLLGGRSPMNDRRNLRTPIFNRMDQVQTETIFLFVFKNGNGLEAGRFIFTPKQLNRGMPWLLEQIAKRWGIYPKRLATMDGGVVGHPGALVHKGAYILVPLGEMYRDTWYYLPDQAKDTSVDSEDMKNAKTISGGEPGLAKGNVSNRRKSVDDSKDDGSDVSDDSRTESGQNSPQEQSYEEYSDEDDRSRNESRATTVSKADTMTLEGSEDLDNLVRTHHRGHHYSDHKSRSSLGNPRSTSAMSQCSYCSMLEKHLAKHHGHSHASPRVSPRHSHTSRSDRRDSEEDDRKRRVQTNVRSISTSPTRSEKASKKQLSASENHGSRRSSSQSVRRSHSDANVFYAKKSGRKSPKSVTRATSDHGDGVFHAKSNRTETHGARAVKESKRTKVEIPLDHRKPRVVSEERVPAHRSRAKKSWQ